MLARRAIGAGFVAGVAAPPHAPFEHYDTLAHFGKIRQHRLPILVGDDLSAQGNRDHEIRCSRARAILAHAMAAALRLEMLCVTEVDQRIEARHRFEYDVAAFAAISAIGPAIFDVFLAPKADSAGPAPARANVNLGLIEKMHGEGLPQVRRNVACALREAWQGRRPCPGNSIS